MCFYPMLEKAEKAMEDAAKGVISRELEETILNIIISPGIVSVLSLIHIFLSVAFAGITSLINMFEAVSESWQNRFKLPRKAAVALCSGIALLVGIFLESEPKVGSWMDFITIIVVPFGAVLGLSLIHIYFLNVRFFLYRKTPY